MANERFYLPISGTSGIVKMTIEGQTYELPISNWIYDNQTQHTQLATASSYPYVDIIYGWKTLSLTFSGIARADFNLHLNAHLKQNVVADIQLLATGIVGQFTTTKARSERFRIGNIKYTQDADGVLSYVISGSGSWKFTHLGNLDA